MQFKVWLFETDVKAWQPQINKFASNRDFAFTNWFPQDGRVYIPFHQAEGLGVDDDISQYFGGQDSEYKIYDYKKGLLKDSKGRLMRIGKVLNNDEAKELKKIEILYQQKKISDFKYKKEISSTKKYYQDLRTAYEASPLRRDANNKESGYMIVITSRPDDVAGMSTNRDWTSCMDLSGGANKQSIWCELKAGGFVAYLCRADDKDVDRPLARLHIRRFDNKEGKSIALPEESVYGNELEGFKEQVQAWLDSKQGRIRPGRYVRRGGWYSDTFGSANPQDSRRKQRKDMTHVILPSTGKGLLKVLEKKLVTDQSSSIVYKLMGRLLDPKVKLDDATKQRVVELVKTIFPRLRQSLFTKFPDMTTPEDFRNMGHYERQRMMKLKKDDPQYAEVQKEIARQAIMNLDINDPNLRINQGEDSAGAYGQVSDILRLLDDLGNLPEPIIRKLVHFADQVIDKYKKELDSWEADKDHLVSPRSRYATGVLADIIHRLNMGHADTPTVINFYHKVLPYWNILDGDEWLTSSLASLGKNGESFLPLLRKKLQEKEMEEQQVTGSQWDKERAAKVTEKFRYAIDAIENGTGHSTKYQY